MLGERDYMRSDYKLKKVKKKKEKYGINEILFKLYLVLRFFRKKK